MAYQKAFLHRKMKLFSGFFLVFLSNILQTLFGIFSRIFMSSEAIKIAPPLTLSQENNQAESNFSEPRTEDETRSLKSCDVNQVESNSNLQEAESKNDCSGIFKEDKNSGIEEEEEESPKLVFKFEYQTWNSSEELNESNSENCDFVNPETAISSTSRYEFVSGKIFSQFLEEPEVPNFTIKEVYINSSDENLETKAVNDSGFVAMRDFKAAEIPENSKEKIECMMAKEASAADDFLSEDDFIMDVASESDSTGSNLDSLFENQLNSSTSDAFLFLSDIDFGTSIDEENAVDLEFENFDVGYEAEDFDEEEEDRDLMEELRKIQQSEMQNSEKISQLPNREKDPVDCSDDSAKSAALDSSEDSSHLETLWEHQDLLEQLKMELKRVRATGLPTILEDSESPRIMEDLKPWKIDEKFHHGNGINELPKFYKSYRERMRKFDILNYQKMYAIGCLQSKVPLELSSIGKSSAPAVTTLLSQSFGLYRRKKTEPDPMKKFIRELYCDLEMVYVGQLCLSWEFLQWEYEKALELWESHQHGSPSYNEVAGEFQQFQVLLQRFIENEPFQGPRVENYVKNRCVMKNLLQVPIIREDSTKSKRKLRKRETESDAITSEMLVEMVEESIRTLWRFIRADKYASSMNLKGELKDPADSELFMQIRADLRKKEKRLREVLRSGKCVLKKLKRHKEEGNGTEQFLYFFSQVDMKLVRRVLNMSTITTDQLAWCRSKLDKVNFVNRRRIHVEQTFLLFPC